MCAPRVDACVARTKISYRCVPLKNFPLFCLLKFASSCHTFIHTYLYVPTLQFTNVYVNDIVRNTDRTGLQ